MQRKEKARMELLILKKFKDKARRKAAEKRLSMCRYVEGLIEQDAD